MKEGWTHKTLGDIAKISSGKSIPSSNISEMPSPNTYPCFGGNGLRGYVSQYLYNGKYPIIGRVGALCGNVHFADGCFYPTEHALVVSIKGKDNPFFITYLLKSLELGRYAKGVAQHVLSASTLSAIEVNLPSIKEQEQIVTELDLLSSIIDKQKKQLEELDNLAQSIFYEMFGDPVTNEKSWKIMQLGEICEYAKTRINSDNVLLENYVGVDNLLQKCQGKTNAAKIPEGLGLTKYH